MKIKLQRKKRRILNGAAACLILCGSLYVNAESVTYESDTYTYFLNNALLNEQWAIHEGIFTVDGKPAYCIEPKETVAVGEDLYETADWDTYNGYSDDVKQRIAEYACFGYGSEGFSDMESWYATQILVWQAINPGFSDTRVWKDPSYAHDLCRSSDAVEITDTVRSRMAAIQSRIDESHREVHPLFQDADGNILNTPLSAEAGDLIVMKDEYGVLADYELVNETEGVAKNGSTFIIDTAKMQGDADLHFSYGGFEPSLSAPFLLKSRDGSAIQTMIIRGRCDVRQFSVRLHVDDAKLRMIKTDARYGSESPNGAVLKGAQYELRNESRDQSCGIFTAGESGVSDVISGLNNADTYSLREITAPKGYQRDRNIHTFTLRDLNKEDGVCVITLCDQVITGRIAIHKVVASRQSSDIAHNEKGAVFTVLSDRALEKYGSFENAIAHYDEIPDPEKSVITTDEDGYGESGSLAYGGYTARQTKASDENLELCDDFRFAIEENSEKPLVFEVSNLPSEYRLRIIKKDAESGRPVSFSSAAFQIIDESGKPLVQKVGSASFDTFMTSSETGVHKPAANVYADTSSTEGQLVLPLPLTAGRYELREVSAPQGYALNTQPVSFEISRAALVRGEIPYVEVSFENRKQTGSVHIHKTVEKPQCSTGLLKEDDLSGIAFTLYAAADIHDCLDGSLLYEKGQEVTVLKTDSTGNADAERLPYGEYMLKETCTKSGLIPAYEEKMFEISEKQQNFSFDFTNRETLVFFSKQQAASAKELPGAKLTVLDEEGNVIDTWISGTEPHSIAGLDSAQTYILREEISPGLSEQDENAYVKAEEIRFSPGADEKGSTVTMKNALASCVKYDENNEPLSGAALCVLDENNEIIDEWISNESAHVIHNLAAGHTYTLCETGSPRGYYPAYDVSFTADGKEDQLTAVHDAPLRVQVRKIRAETGEDLPGVLLKLYEMNAKGEESLLLEWTTDGTPKQIGPYLQAGTMYRLEEAESADGVYPAADLYFSTDLYDPLNEEPLIITMIDTEVKTGAVKTDENGHYLCGAHMSLSDQEGNIVHEWISDMKPEDLSPYVKGNGTYILKETSSPQGYALAMPLSFTVSGNSAKNQILRAVDRNVRIHLTVIKTDGESGEPLKNCEAAVFRVKDDSPARDVNGSAARLKTDEKGEAHVILPYDPDGYYVLETKAPKGYRLNRSRFDLKIQRENNPAAVFEEIRITDEKKTVHTGVRSSGGWLLISAGVLLACIAGTLQCINLYRSYRSHR